jgi:hypothetical protein
MAQLQSLYNNGNLIPLNFSQQPRSGVMLEETNGQQRTGKRSKKSIVAKRNKDVLGGVQ